MPCSMTWRDDRLLIQAFLAQELHELVDFTAVPGNMRQGPWADPNTARRSRRRRLAWHPSTCSLERFGGGVIGTSGRHKCISAQSTRCSTVSR